MSEDWNESHYKSRMCSVHDLSVLVTQWMQNLDDDGYGLGIEVVRGLIDHLVAHDLMTIDQIQVVCFNAYNEWAGK